MGRPRLIVYELASVDGRLTVAPDALLLYGDERWSAAVGECHDPYEWLLRRFAPQVFLEGSGSFVLEAAASDASAPDADPAQSTAEDNATFDDAAPATESGFAAQYEDFLPAEVVAAPGRCGWFAAVDGRGRVRWTIKEWPDPAFAGWYLLVLASRATPASYLAFLRNEGIPYIVAGADRVDLPHALEHMAARLGVTTVVATPGGRLGGALLRAGVVDEVIVDLFPALIGGTATPALFTAPDLAPDAQATRLRLLYDGVEPNGHVRLHYAVEAR